MSIERDSSDYSFIPWTSWWQWWIFNSLNNIVNCSDLRCRWFRVVSIAITVFGPVIVSRQHLQTFYKILHQIFPLIIAFVSSLINTAHVRCLRGKGLDGKTGKGIYFSLSSNWRFYSYDELVILIIKKIIIIILDIYKAPVTVQKKTRMAWKICWRLWFRC